MRSKIGAALAATLFWALALVAPAHANFPGDPKGKIAFVQNNAAIYTIDPDGGNRRALTTAPGKYYAPEWSWLGTQIVFSSSRDDPNPTSCNPCNTEIYVMNADGSNQTRLTNDPAADGNPHWSPDGTKIVFDSNRTGGGDIYSMNADGTGVTRLTTNPLVDEDPVWSSDGARIAYSSMFLWPTSSGYAQQVILMDPDGTNRTFQANNPDWVEAEPDWSPDRTQIAYQQPDCPGFDNCGGSDTSHLVATMNPDGTATHVFHGPDTAPSWSPDGTRIAVANESCQDLGDSNVCTPHDILTMNPDGSGIVNVTNNDSVTFAADPAWQPVSRLSVNVPYVRPKGATPLSASLVPASTPCTAPNRSHGSPLAFPSCAPPQQASSQLTVGTPDANGQGANSRGSLLIKAVSGDVTFDLGITDVRRQSDLSDYSGQLQVDLPLRLTDREAPGEPYTTGPVTVADTHFRFAVSCGPTASTTVGSTCAISTTANAVAPGAVVAGRRAIWQLGPVQIYDGGADGVASTTNDNTVFMNQGLFVP